MSQNTRTLLTIAAEMRAVGHSWESVGRSLQRKAGTCQAWTKRFRDEWNQIYRQVQTRRFHETSDQAHTLIQGMMRSHDVNLRFRAVQLWIKNGAAAYGYHGSMCLPNAPPIAHAVEQASSVGSGSRQTSELAPKRNSHEFRYEDGSRQSSEPTPNRNSGEFRYGNLAPYTLAASVGAFLMIVGLLAGDRPSTESASSFHFLRTDVPGTIPHNHPEDTRMNRREFLSVAAGTTVALSADAKDDPKMIPIVDCHQHLWDLSKFKLAWVKEGDPLAVSYTPKEYAQATKGLGFVKSVYMEVDVVEEQQQKEADYLIELIKSKETITVAAVISGRPNKGESFKKYVAQFKGSPYIKGLRQVVHNDGTPPGYSTTKEFIAGIQHLGELGLSWDICIRPADLGDAAKLVSECPGTRFILDHCGNAPILDAKKMEAWKKDIAKVAEKKNAMGKVSGIIASVKKGDWSVDQLAPAVKHTIEVFGWDRVMFASDWPVCTLGAPLKEWVAAAKEIVKDAPEANQRKLFGDNAIKFYGLG